MGIETPTRLPQENLTESVIYKLSADCWGEALAGEVAFFIQIMVQIHVNQTHDNQFLYNCSYTSRIDDIAREIIQTCNLQAKIHFLVSKVEERLLAKSKECHPDSVLALRRVLSEAKSYASKEQVLYKKPLSLHVLRDHIQNIERALRANQLVSSSDPDLSQEFLSDLELLHEDEAQLWWAGKEFSRDKRLCDYVGSNEKTKIVVRVNSPGPGCNSTV